MKKLVALTVAAMAMFTSVAMAGDKINVVKYSRAGGLTDRMNENIAAALGDNFGEFIQVKGCAAAKKVIESSSTPTVAAWQTEYLVKDGKCSVDENLFQGSLASAPYYICHMADNAQAADVNFFKNGDIKVALWDSAFWSVPQTDFIQSVNPKAKVITYKSKPFKTALPSGEVDYKMSTIPKDGEACVAVLGETGEGIPSGKSFGTDSNFAELGYMYSIVGTAEVQKTVHSSDAWANRKDTKYQTQVKSYAETLSFLNEIQSKMAK